MDRTEINLGWDWLGCYLINKILHIYKLVSN